ncbi:Cyclin-K [Fasciolopsis buskii]|uniref:Cyclin-K n=1 Tax=Fasciolopsis buskii TaxID=27845 RepID=A0A8E0S2V4_9TREM|nr:Cyclin-K [Fasciolopsis buski]
MSWSFINDSLATTLCLQWEPEIVAGAALYLATRVSRYTIEDWEGKQPGVRWWESFVEGMSTEILDLYPAGAPAEAPGPSTTSAPRNPNPVPPSSTSSSIRNHPSFNAAASAANTVGSGPLSKDPASVLAVI